MHFPLAGIDLSMGFDTQNPRPVLGGYSRTTPVGQNVRAFDCLQSRARGGSRPGLAKYISQVVGSPSLIQDLAVVVGVGYAAPGPTTTVLRQVSAGNTTTSGTTLAETLTVAAGSYILVAVGSTGGTYPDSVTDGQGNTYTRTSNASQSNVTVSYWVTPSVGAGSLTVTCNHSTALPMSMLTFELALTATTPDIQTNVGGVGTTGNNLGNGINTTHASDFVIVATQQNDIGTIAGTGWFWVQNGATFTVGYKTLSSTASNVGAELTWAFNSFTSWTGILTAFKA